MIIVFNEMCHNISLVRVNMAGSCFMVQAVTEKMKECSKKENSS